MVHGGRLSASEEPGALASRGDETIGTGVCSKERFELDNNILQGRQSSQGRLKQATGFAKEFTTLFYLICFVFLVFGVNYNAHNLSIHKNTHAHGLCAQNFTSIVIFILKQSHNCKSCMYNTKTFFPEPSESISQHDVPSTQCVSLRCISCKQGLSLSSLSNVPQCNPQIQDVNTDALLPVQPSPVVLVTSFTAKRSNPESSIAFSCHSSFVTCTWDKFFGLSLT